MFVGEEGLLVGRAVVVGWRKALKKPERKKGLWVEGAMVGYGVGVCEGEDWAVGGGGWSRVREVEAG